MTEKFLEYRKKKVLKNIAEERIYDVEAQYHEKTKRKKDGRVA